MTGSQIVAGERQGGQFSKRMLSRMSSLEEDLAEVQLRVSLLEERCDELALGGGRPIRGSGGRA